MANGTSSQPADAGLCSLGLSGAHRFYVPVACWCYLREDACSGHLPTWNCHASTAVGWLGLLVYLEMSPLSAVVWECCVGCLCTVLLSWVGRRVSGGDFACVTRPLGTELPVFSPSSSKVADLPWGFPHWVDSVYSKRNNVLFIFINYCLY